ncbi:winged helix-turn-helix transcriptional regulator [Tritonibacter mobilis]|uniref:winged helix-turn-helix transcriptional regulator n=1 Tax=Tritonibacter mobilis TaxID=379347 RepID=UPI000806B864|nr:winged helix-turn-helix transcriptional regulator [Tritonibacter mobilis]
MTKQAKSKRVRYDEGCLAAHALNLIGDRWALLVVRELMFTPKRFQMIRAGLPGITASVLTGRLTQLVEIGVVLHDTRLGVYSLSGQGRGLLPVLESLCRWALMMPGHDPSRFISPSALMISMGVNLIQERAAGRSLTAGFDFTDEAFEMRLDGAALETRFVIPPQAPFVITGTGNTMAAAVYGARPLPDLVAANMVTVSGDMEAAQEFLALFQLGKT